MIQRIQTLYLLLVVALMAVVNFFPLVMFRVMDGMYVMTSTKVYATLEAEQFDFADYWCKLLPVFSVITIAIAVAAIFSYKNRIRQMRYCIYAILTILVYYGCFGMQVWSVYKATEAMPLPTLIAQLPLISIVILFLAGRAIKRDEDLVRSTDRIR